MVLREGLWFESRFDPKAKIEVAALMRARASREKRKAKIEAAPLMRVRVLRAKSEN